MTCNVCQIDIPADLLSPVVAGCVRLCPQCAQEAVRTLTGDDGYEFPPHSPEYDRFERVSRIRRARGYLERAGA